MGRATYLGDGIHGQFPHRFESLPISQLANGYHLSIPVITIEGKYEGPTLGLTAGVHGDEHTGTECIRRILTTLDPSQLRGRIMAIPVVNPLAFEARTRNTPLDMLNLNRVFPGDRSGWLTDQLASVLVEKYLSKLDYLVDFHAGGDGGWIDYVIVDDRELALATGGEYLYVGTTPAGTMKGAARDLGVKATVTTEFGGNNCSNTPLVQKGVQVVQNVMRYWGMLPGEPERPSRQYLFKTKKVLRCTQGGILYQDPKNTVIGTEVPRDALLGTIVSPYTFEVLEELRAPFERNLVFHVHEYDGRVHPGEFLFQCADLDSAEILEQ